MRTGNLHIDDIKTNNIYIIKRLAEHLAAEIMAEADEEMYATGFDDQIEDLLRAKEAIEGANEKTPYLVSEVLRLSAECRSRYK